MKNNKMLGFTLIELLVVVVIVGILVAIAQPSFTRTYIESRRADAHAKLFSTAQWMEQQALETNAYPDPATAGYVGGFPTTFTRLSVDGLYQVTSVAAGSGETYRLDAVPVTGQSQVNDTDCQSIRLYSTGRKASGTVTNPDIDNNECW